MPRYIITIRKPGQPTTYYLSRNGYRCYSAVNVAVFRSLEKAQSTRDDFAGDMPDFVLSLERLPARMTARKGILSAVPV